MRKFLLLVLIAMLPVLMLANAILDKSISRPLFAPNIIKIQLTEKAIQSTDLPEGLYAESARFGLTELDNIKSRYGSAKVIRAHIRLKDTEYERTHGVARWFLVKYETSIDVLAAIKAFQASSLVQLATPEYYAYTQAIPNDPYYPNNWGHNNTAQLPFYTGGSHSGAGVGTVGFDSNAQAAWDYPQGYGSAAIIIAIIDTGVDTAHPDLRLVAGYDYGDNDSNPMDNSADPGHGTACSGVAAGRGNNSLGIAGMAPGCSVMPLKIASSDGSLGFTAIENALYHCGNNNVDVASMSFGASMSPGSSPSTDTAVAYAYSNGVAMFAATANANASTIDYPSNHPNVISVGAASPSGQRKSYTSSDGETWWGSNYGTTTQDANTAVDIMAPTILPATDITGAGNGYNTSSDYYMWFNGTSCATPYAAGMAALVLSHTPSLTPDQLRTVITSTCTDMTVDGGAGWDRYTGYGMVNAEAALASLLPGMPTCDITAPASGTSYTLGDVVTVNVTATDPATRSINDVKFYLDGSPTPSYTDNTAPYSWAWNTTGISGGSHSIRAMATDNEGNTASDLVSVVVMAPADEGFESGNFSAFAWNNTSASPWTVQSTEKFSGTYAAKSGVISDNGSTTLSLQMTISASGNISFYYKVSSEANYDYLRFYIDGVQQAQWSGSAGWAEATYPVTSGSRTFTWTYSKDVSVATGSDCAWIDHIIFPPHGAYFAPPRTLVAAPSNGSVGLSWQVPESGTPSSYKIYRNSTLLTTTVVTSYTDNAVVNGTQYSYYVKAVYTSPAGESEPSNTVIANPGTIVIADYIVGTGTSSTATDAASPINVYYESLHGQSVYTAAELNAAGVYGPCDITRIGFNVTALPTLAMPNYLIRMGHTTATNVSSWISTGLSTVWTIASYQPTATGWNRLTLTTPFVWNGTSNLVIDTAFGDIGAWIATGTVQYTNTASGYRFARSDTADQTDVFTGGETSQNRPNITLTTSYVPPAPAIEVNPLSLSYGTVRINSTSSATFQISNPGGALLTGNITTPTGYTVALGRDAASSEAGLGTASLTKSNSRNILAYSIAAGGSSTFTVTFAPIAAQAYNGNITITHNADGASKTVALTGQGGKSTIGLSATTFVASLTPGGSTSQNLSVSNSGNMSLNYNLTINGSVPWLTLNGGTTVSNTIAVGGAAQNVNLGFNGTGLAPGTYNATVNGTSNDHVTPTFNINVTLTVNTPIAISAPGGGVSWQSGINNNIIWNYSGHATGVTLLYSTNGGSTYTQIAVVPVVQGVNSYLWNVPYVPSSSCRIRVTDNISPNVSVNSNIFSIVTPAINVSQTALNFGVQRINTTATANFTIINIGSATLNGNITTPTGYSVAVARAEDETWGLGDGSDTRNTLPYSLSPSASRTFTLTFAPTLVQSYNGSVTITHNAQGASRTIALTGQGGKSTIGLSATTFNASLTPGGFTGQNLSISNSGNMSLNYSLTINGSVPWLTLNGGTTVSNTIAVGGAAQIVSLGFNGTGLAPGTYNATVNGTSDDNANEAFNISVVLTVNTPITISAPGGGVSWQSGINNNIIWNYSGHATGVTLLYSTNGGSTYTQIAVVQVVQGVNSYLWNVPYVPSSSCRIRITDNISPNVSVNSNIFSIVTPAINVSQTALDFGVQLINTTATANFTIINTGSATLNGNITTPTGFSVAVARAEDETWGLGDGSDTRNTLPYSLFPSGSRTFTLTFEPTLVQSYNGSVSITHNAQGATRTISLTAEGARPDIVISDLLCEEVLPVDNSTTHNITVQNNGNFTLIYSLEIPDRPSWVNINGGSIYSNSIPVGGAADNISLNLSATGLAPGVYNTTINGSSNDPEHSTFFVAVSLEVFDPNVAPLIDLPAQIALSKNNSLDVDFSLYVSDADNDDLWLTYVESAHVTVGLNGLMVTLTPTEGWTGSEELSFTVHDGIAEATDVVSVVVTNTAPVLSLPDSFSFDRNGNLSVDFDLYVSDGDGDMLSLMYTGNDGVNISVDGPMVTFSNDPDFAGSEDVTFTISDGTDTAQDVVTITVVNHAPVLDPPASFGMNQNTSLTIDFSLCYSDPDNDALVLGYSNSANVAVELNGTNVTFTPVAGWYGDEPIIFTVHDGYLQDEATVIIHVNQVIGSLDTPVISISHSAGNTLLQWQAIPNATEYWIFRASDPYGIFNQIGTTSLLEYQDLEALPKAFYQVKAVSIPFGK